MRQLPDKNKKRFNTGKRADRLLLHSPRRRKAGNPSRALLILAGVAALSAFVLLGNYLIQGQRLRRQQAELAAAFHQTNTIAPTRVLPETTPIPAQSTPPQETPVLAATAVPERQAASDRFIPLMRRNNDVVGWLTYPAIPEMDFVVVHRDNNHYLRRSFTGESNLAGTVFMEQSNSIRPRDTNLILHGHNMADGTMFGKLARLMDPAILRREPLLQFDTLYQDAAYVPYALTVFSVDPKAPNYFNIIQTAFTTQEKLDGYVGWLRGASSLSFPTQVLPSDRLLTLVTCHGSDDNERLVLALRAVRPGEDLNALKASLAQGITRR